VAGEESREAGGEGVSRCAGEGQEGGISVLPDLCCFLNAEGVLVYLSDSLICMLVMFVVKIIEKEIKPCVSWLLLLHENLEKVALAIGP
jgi:hypothetical protein